jgi:hypothetical protein
MVDYFTDTCMRVCECVALIIMVLRVCMYASVCGVWGALIIMVLRVVCALAGGGPDRFSGGLV